MNKPEQDRLAKIKLQFELVNDRVGPDSSLRWLIGEVDRLRAELNVLNELLKRLRTKLVTARGFDSDVTLEDLVDHIIYQRRGLLSELAEIHDLTAEVLSYQRAPSIEEDPDCPCPCQFITGDHTDQTLVMELVQEYNVLNSFRQ